MIAVMEYADRLLLEIAVVGCVNVHKFLRIPVDKREPGTLHLDHQPVPLPERMRYIGDGELHCLHLAGSKGFWRFKTFPEAAAHDLAMDKHLVAAHGVGGRVVMTAHGQRAHGRIAEIIREHIDHLYDEIRIGAAEAYLQVGDDGAGK